MSPSLPSDEVAKIVDCGGWSLEVGASRHCEFVA